jgi:hypothetical protein
MLNLKVMKIKKILIWVEYRIYGNKEKLAHGGLSICFTPGGVT